MGTAHRLPINGHHLPRQQVGNRLGPLHETPLELLWVQPGEGVVGGDAVRHFQKEPALVETGVRNHSSLLLPNSSTYTQESAPQMTAQLAMAMMSSN